MPIQKYPEMCRNQIDRKKHTEHQRTVIYESTKVFTIISSHMLLFKINFSIIIRQSTIDVSSGQWTLTAPLITLADF